MVLNGINFKHPGWKVLIYTTGVIVSAILGAVIKDISERPWPVVELTNISFMGETTASSDVDVPSELNLDIRQHPWFPNLDIQVSIQGIRDSMLTGTQRDLTRRRMLSEVIVLVDLVETQSASLSVDHRRKDFLERWSRDPSVRDRLSSKIQSVVYEMQDELPAHYKSHPDEYRNFEVTLPRGTVVLGYFDEESYAEKAANLSPSQYERALLQARGANLARRLWIYYEPEVILKVLSKTREEVEEQLKKSAEIAADLKDLIERCTPSRIQAEATILNRGRRPIAVGKLALLVFEIPESQGGTTKPVYIDLIRTSRADETLIVKGGEVARIDFSSRLTVDEIVRRHQDLLGGTEWANDQRITISRFMKLYEGEGLSARIVLSKAGFSPGKSKMAESSIFPVGTGTDDKVLEALRE